MREGTGGIFAARGGGGQWNFLNAKLFYGEGVP